MIRFPPATRTQDESSEVTETSGPVEKGSGSKRWVLPRLGEQEGSLAVPSTRSKAWFQAGGTGRVGRGKTVFAVVENTDTMLAPPGVTSAGQNTPASSQLCTGSTL